MDASSSPFIVKVRLINIRFSSHTDKPVDDQKEKLKIRCKDFFSLDLEKEATIWSGIHGFQVIISVISCTLVISIIPQNDAIQHPPFWPKTLIRSVNFYFVLVLCLIFDNLLVMNPSGAISVKKVYYTLISVITLMLILSFIAHMMWIYALQYRPPIPFLGILLRWISCAVFYIPFWIQQTIDQHNNTEYTEHYKWLMFKNVLFQVIFVAYYFSVGFFNKIPQQLQTTLLNYFKEQL